jgi:tetratricopeptide (TPR) repeat protein
MLGIAILLPVALGPGPKCTAYADTVVTAVRADPGHTTNLALRLKHECGDDFSALFRAGRAINRTTRFEFAASDRSLRQAAEDLLRRATELRTRDAAAWFEFGLALKKRGGLQVDAFRAINKALALAQQFPDSTPPDLLADILMQRARRQQDWVDRERWLKVPDLGVYTPGCNTLGIFCQNYTRPSDFNALLARTPPVGIDLEGERDTLIRAYREVLRVQPDNAEAAERCARELALAEEWEPLLDLARSGAAQSEPALFRAVAALALYQVGRAAEADSAFAQAVALFPDSVRRWYNPPPGLDTVPDFWRRARPLWLAPYDELALDYRARVTYALIVLGDREGGVIGPETPAGDALIRYGWPRMITQVLRNGRAALSQSEENAVSRFMDCMPADMGGDPGKCEGGPAEGTAADQSSGRWLVWTYDMDRPSFIFELRPSQRVPTYVWASNAEDYARLRREANPITFTSHLAPRTVALPLQITRFKGARPDQTDVLVSGAASAAALQLAAGGRVATGLFVFRQTAGFPLVESRRDSATVGRALVLDYRPSVPPGSYAIAVEALSAASGVAAVARDSVTAPFWRADTLALSDLLLADDVRETGRTATWRDLAIDPSRTLSVAAGGMIWAVWEVYGVAPGPGRTARYEVSLTLQDVNARALPVRLLARLGLVAGGNAPAVTLQWTAERVPAPDGRALEYVALQVPPDAKGSYRLEVSVSDPATQRTATVTRRLTITAP